jgi:hypothetical protein
MASSSSKRRPLGPYSKVLRRGAIRDNVDGRSTEGRFIRDMEAQLIAHVGGNPSFVQRLLFDRLIRVRLQLDALERKMGDGWTDKDSRTYGALLNQFRLTAREIGIKATAPDPGWQEAVYGSDNKAAD